MWNWLRVRERERERESVSQEPLGFTPSCEMRDFIMCKITAVYYLCFKCKKTITGITSCY